MGFLQRLFGSQPPVPQPRHAAIDAAAPADEQAIARYRYLLRTAPPEAIEQAHADAFAQLTPEQRAVVLKQLRDELPESERGAAPEQPDSRALARMATRAELRRPGSLERLLAAPTAAAGMGVGGLLAGSLLSSIAGTFIGTAIAQQFLGGFGNSHEAEASGAGAQNASATSDDDSDADAANDSDGSDYGDGADDFEV